MADEFTYSRRWRRWKSQRSDLVRATQVATDALATWSDTAPDVSIAIEYKRLTERTTDPSALEKLDGNELREIKDVTIVIEQPPELIAARVSLRLSSSSGAILEVQGPDRARVEGLGGELARILQRRVTAAEGFLWGFVSVGALILGFFISSETARWSGLAEQNGMWDAAEVVGGVLGAAVALALAIAVLIGFHYAFPTIEIRAERRSGRE
jgi:hypothetical protein